MMALYLRREGFEVETFSDGRFVVERCAVAVPSAVVVDVVMEEMGGLQTIRHLRAFDSRLPIIVMSGGGADYVRAASELGADTSFTKPFHLSELSRAIKQEVNSGISLQ